MKESLPAAYNMDGHKIMKSIFRLCVVYLALNSTAQAIVNGKVDVGNVYSSVGYTFGLSGAFGSVVAIDSHWVLTAAHVVDALPTPPGIGDPFVVLGDPIALTEGVYGFSFALEEIILHPDHVVGEFHDDIALIRMPSLDPIVPIPGLIDMSFATLSNVDLDPTSPDFMALPGTSRITGYGVTAVGEAPDPTDPILRRHGDAPTYAGDPFATPGISFMDPGFPSDCSQAMLLCTYSTGAPPGTNAAGAPGDSGGAVWLDYGGGEIVAGINSFIFDENDIDPSILLDWTDGSWTVGTSTAYYEDRIRGVVEGAGGTVRFGAVPVPIPPAVYLFVAGLLGVMGISLKRT